MTYEEKQKAIIRAKIWIQDVMYTHQDVVNGEEPDDTIRATLEECEVILNALESQIPKKPLGGTDIMGNEYKICRHCSAIIEDGEWRADYCPDCGQAIDWSDEA